MRPSETRIVEADSEESDSGKRWQFLLKLSFSLALTGFVLSLVNFRELVKVLATVNVLYLLAAVALAHVDRGLMAYKWRHLLRAVNVEVRFLDLFRTYSVAPVWGVLLPSTIGSDLFRLYTVGRLKSSSRAVLASIVVERFIGLMACVLVAAVSLGLASYWIEEVRDHFARIGWTLWLGIMAAAALLGGMHSIFRGAVDKFARRFRGYLIFSKVHHVYRLCYEYRNSLRTVTIVSAWSIVEQMVPVLANIFMVRALGMNVSLTQLVVIIPLIVFAIRIPISISGFGVQEGLYIALFGVVGVSVSEAFLLSMLGRVVGLVSALPWAVHFIMKRPQMPIPNEPIRIVRPE